jgi:hypothetical protein
MVHGVCEPQGDEAMAFRISDKVSIGLGGIMTLLAVKQSLYTSARSDDE